MSGIPVVDLFSGAGGLGLGAIQAGGNLMLSVDNDPFACQTLRENKKFHNSMVLEDDIKTMTGSLIRKLIGLKKKDSLVIVGGPPCQPFSKNSYWTDPGEESKYRQARARGEKAIKPKEKPKARPDKRRSLVMEFLRLVVESRADAFLFENVPSLLHPRNRNMFDQLVNSAENSGYKTAFKKALAVEYGVPQKRERIFLIGMKKDAPTFAKSTHHRKPRQNSSKKPAVTAGDALLPFADAKYFEPEEVVEGKWAEHLRTVPPGMNYKAHTAWAGHPKPTFVTETRFWNFLLKLHPDLPSWTIAANPGPWTGPFHWGNRRLRTPEMAALQAFPKGYKFSGNRRERVRQVGNAVPPLLAAKMLEPTIKKL